MKLKATGAAAAAALSYVSAPAIGATCDNNNYFEQYLAGGDQANCTFADKSLLGVSQNETAQNAGIFVNEFDLTPNDPGIAWGIDTLFGAANGASFVFTVTAPANSPINGFSLDLSSFSVGGPVVPSPFTTVDVTLSNGDTLSATDDGISHSISFAATTELTVTTTISSNDWSLTGGPIENFSEVAPAIPEPSSIALVGVGLSATALRLRRRRGRSA
jgi:hypothetical protein